MTILPSPIPHPLDFCPWDLPGWAYEALEWVVGFQWPDGNEAETWDVADRWYALADILGRPRDEAFEAAAQVMSGYGGSGITADAFMAAWDTVSLDENAPLNSLMAISHELGKMVEGCGCDIEGAKIEAWIELGIFVIELIGMAVAVVLTLGAASPAAGGLIAATRFAIQQIFKKLIEALSKKAIKKTLKEAGERAAKQLTTKAGLKHLGKDALREGLDEAEEEYLTNGAIQVYQNSTGRRDGVNWGELGMSTLGGFAGGFAASGAGIGKGGHGGSGLGDMVRGAGGEVLAEFGGAAVSGQLPDLEGLAKSASSGVTGSAMHSTKAGMSDALSGLSVPDLGSSLPSSSSASLPDVSSALSTSDGGSSGTSGLPSSGSSVDPSSARLPHSSAPSLSAGSSPSVGSTSVDLPTVGSSLTVGSSPTVGAPHAMGSSPTVGDLSLSALASPTEAPAPVAAHSDPTFAGPAAATGAPAVTPQGGLVAAPPGSAGAGRAGVGQAGLGSWSTVTAPTVTAPEPPDGAWHVKDRPDPRPGPPPAPQPPPIPSPRPPVDRIAEALAPSPIPAPPPLDLLSSPSPAPTPRFDHEAHARQAYFGYAAHVRNTFEDSRREESAEYLVSRAEKIRADAADLLDKAGAADRDGLTLRADRYRRSSREAAVDADVLQDEADGVRTGEITPATVDVEGRDWTRINDDIGDLARGAVETDDSSRITDDDHPPPIDRSRRYDRSGGLRRPLAVHQTDLERAMPRDADGRVQRLADPRIGRWFGLANDGGPENDPTRGINCLDGVLSFFETYMHGRPRVSAPRTFDSYAEGDTIRPLGAEDGGLARIQDTVRGEFQGLCPHVGGIDRALARQAVDRGMTNLSNHLHNVGHGAFAFIVTDSEGGTAHAWAAVNHHGTILFLDPQTRRISENTPLYQNYGVPTHANVVSMDALVVDGNGEWSSLPYHEAGPWSGAALEPTADEEKTPAQLEEERILATLTGDERRAIDKSALDSEKVAARVSTDMHEVAASLGNAEVVDEQYRVKSVASLARKFKEREATRAITLDSFLETANDRVRFSITCDEQGYGRTVQAALDQFAARGYTVEEVASFWGDGRGRHNGLNVTMTDPDGFRMELQFPTEKSRAVGKKTHHLYEIVRLDSEETSSADRVEAFLQILNVNKTAGMADHQPESVDEISGIVPVDTSFRKWAMGAGTFAWQEYRAGLAQQGISFADALRQWNLTLSDIPGYERLGLIDEPSEGGVPRLSGSEGFGRGDEPDRLHGSAPRAPEGGHVARGPEGVDFRSGPGSASPVRRDVPGRVDRGGPDGGGEDRAGAVADGAAERGEDRGDVRGRGTDGLEVRPAVALGSTEVADSLEQHDEHLSEATAAERRAFDSLSAEDRQTLLASEQACQSIANGILDGLHMIVNSLEGYDESDRPRVIDDENRVKTVYSLARAYQEQLKFDNIDLPSFLDHTKDRVRFSILVSVSCYGRSVAEVLCALKSCGYASIELVSFWGGGGRHNGLNVTMADGTGFRLEIQFPTELSRGVGKATHRHYEIVRQEKFSIEQRVEAFLSILSINKASKIYSHQPRDLQEVGQYRYMDSTFHTWVVKNPHLWQVYNRRLESDQVTFDRVLERFGLDRNDVFGQ